MTIDMRLPDGATASFTLPDQGVAKDVLDNDEPSDMAAAAARLPSAEALPRLDDAVWLAAYDVGAVAERGVEPTEPGPFDVADLGYLAEVLAARAACRAHLGDRPGALADVDAALAVSASRRAVPDGLADYDLTADMLDADDAALIAGCAVIRHRFGETRPTT